MLDWLRRDPREEQVLDIGGRDVPIEVRHLTQARRMTMRIAPDGSAVRISVPRWVPEREAVAFARSRSQWIAAQLAALPPAEPLADGGTVPFHGEALQLRHDPGVGRRVVVDDGALLVGGAETSLLPRVERWLKAEAKAAMTADLAHYCARAALPAPPLSLSSAQRRWGSCAADGAIRMNWRLIMAPDAVRRSVVAHEVAHLVHFDHSPAFHMFLAQLFEGNVHHANRWLKTQGRTLYAPFG